MPSRSIINEPVRECIRQVDSSTWLIGTFILHRSSCPSKSATWNDDSDGSSYTLTAAPTPRPAATSLPDDHSLIKQVYKAGYGSTWSIRSNAFCKVHPITEGKTPEATTLEFVRRQKRNFRIPELLQHCEYNGRSYLFLGRVPGQTLMEAWPSLSLERQHYYADAIANICKDLADLKGDRIGGVDGKNMAEYYLIRRGAAEDFSSANLQAECEAIGVDCSSFVFYHADLGPGNIIVNGTNIGIIDWESAGYYPKGWVMTKFQVSGGMGFNEGVTEDPQIWQKEVLRRLMDIGFETYGEAWWMWAFGEKPSYPEA